MPTVVLAMSDWRRRQQSEVPEFVRAEVETPWLTARCKIPEETETIIAWLKREFLHA